MLLGSSGIAYYYSRCCLALQISGCCVPSFFYKIDILRLVFTRGCFDLFLFMHRDIVARMDNFAGFYDNMRRYDYFINFLIRIHNQKVVVPINT